jgi:hypothetical protein
MREQNCCQTRTQMRDQIRGKENLAWTSQLGLGRLGRSAAWGQYRVIHVLFDNLLMDRLFKISNKSKHCNEKCPTGLQ